MSLRSTNGVRPSFSRSSILPIGSWLMQVLSSFAFLDTTGSAVYTFPGSTPTSKIGKLHEYFDLTATAQAARALVALDYLPRLAVPVEDDRVGGVLSPQSGCLRCLLLVMCTHLFAKKALTLHLARSEGRARYFGCNLMHRKVLASSHQHLMAEAPSVVRSPGRCGAPSSTCRNRPLRGRAIDPDAVEWTFDASLGDSNAVTLEHG